MLTTKTDPDINAMETAAARMVAPMVLVLWTTVSHQSYQACAVPEAALIARICLAAFFSSSSRSRDATSSSSASARSPRNRSGFSKKAMVASSGLCPSATGSGICSARPGRAGQKQLEAGYKNPRLQNSDSENPSPARKGAETVLRLIRG
jgi:hypothetical protein